MSTTTTTTVVHVDARRWFQSSYGNTYHTVAVYVDGEHIGTSGHTYGYGEHFQHTAGTVVLDSDHPAADRLRDYLTGACGPDATDDECAYGMHDVAHNRVVGATYSQSVADVQRRKDLHTA